MNPVNRFFTEIRDTTMHRHSRAWLLVCAMLALALGGFAVYMIIGALVESYHNFGLVGLIVTGILASAILGTIYYAVLKDDDA